MSVRPLTQTSKRSSNISDERSQGEAAGTGAQHIAGMDASGEENVEQVTSDESSVLEEMGEEYSKDYEGMIRQMDAEGDSKGQRKARRRARIRVRDRARFADRSEKPVSPDGTPKCGYARDSGAFLSGGDRHRVRLGALKVMRIMR